MGNIAIHGFGRIGRSTMKAALNKDLFVPAAVSDIKDIGTLAALFEVDTNYGRWSEKVVGAEAIFEVGAHKVSYLNASQMLPYWGGLGVDLVIDCTGRATVRAGAQAHLTEGRDGSWSAPLVKPLMIATPCCCPASILTGLTLRNTGLSAWPVAQAMPLLQ